MWFLYNKRTKKKRTTVVVYFIILWKWKEIDKTGNIVIEFYYDFVANNNEITNKNNLEIIHSPRFLNI